MVPSKTLTNEPDISIGEPPRLTTYATFYRGDQRRNGPVRPNAIDMRQSKKETVLRDRKRNLNKFGALGDVFTSSYQRAFVPFFGVASNYPKRLSSRDTLDYWLPWDRETASRCLTEYDAMRRECLPDESPVLLHASPSCDPVTSRVRRTRNRFRFCLTDDDTCPEEESPTAAPATEVERESGSTTINETGGVTGWLSDPTRPAQRERISRKRPTDADIRRFQLERPTPIWLRDNGQNPSSIFGREYRCCPKKRRPGRVKYASPSTLNRNNLIARGIIPSAFPATPIRIPHVATLPKPFVQMGTLNSIPGSFWTQWDQEGYEGPPCDQERMRWISAPNPVEVGVH